MFTTKIHTVRLRLILLLLSLLIVACGTAATTPESESGAANDTPSGDPISFAVFGDQAELSAFEAVVAAFEAEYPEIDIEIQHTASQSDYRQRLATSFSAGSPPTSSCSTIGASASSSVKMCWSRSAPTSTKAI